MFKNLKELYRFRHLLYIFTARDILGRYKQAFIGILWAVVQPLFLMIIFTVVFSKFLKVSSGNIPYPVFSYVALLPWTFIRRSLTASSKSLLSFKSIITKIYFPREIAPLSIVMSSLIDFFIGLLVFLGLLLYYKIGFSWYFAFLLILIPLQILLASALALFISSLTVFFRDLEFAIPLFIQLWLYASPVIYSVNNIKGDLKFLFYLNPSVGIIESYRQTILLKTWPQWDFLLVSFIFSTAFFIFSYWFFKKTEKQFIDII